MTNLKTWQNKIKEKRKQTSFRDFIKYFASQRSLTFHKNNGFTSIFPSERITNIITHKQYYDKRDALDEYGIDYDANNNFFKNFESLYKIIPFPPTILIWECENSDFSDQTLGTKDVYLSFVTIKDCEKIAYSISTKEWSRNVFNSMMVWDNSESIYFSTGAIKSSNIFYSKYVINSYNIYFSTNLIWCSDCIDCSDLENQKYCIENKQYSKEEYEQRKQEILKNKEGFLEKYKQITKNYKGKNIASTNTTWVFNIECNDISDAYFNYQIKNGKNLFLVGGKQQWEDMYDCFLHTPPQKDVYGAFSSGFSDNIYNSMHVARSSNIYYSMNLEACSFCIWCIGLKNKSYCILNKEYSKHQWEVLADKIFSQMDQDGVLWEFFPGSFNPFYFNDTMAKMLGNFTKQEVTSEWYMWRDEEVKVDIPETSDIVSTADLRHYQWYDRDGDWKINEAILNKVIKDENGNYYRIVQMEYDFLQKHSLPLPEIHWLDRMKLNFWV